MHDQIGEGREMIKRDLVFNDTWLKDVYHVSRKREKRHAKNFNCARDKRQLFILSCQAKVQPLSNAISYFYEWCLVKGKIGFQLFSKRMVC